MSLLGLGLGLGASLVSPLIDATRGTSRAEKAMEKYLKTRGVTDADIQRRLSQQAGVLADQTDLAKNAAQGQLVSQGLGDSIIGSQLGLQADAAANQALVGEQGRLLDAQKQDQMRRQEMLLQSRMAREQAKRQGRADFAGNLLGGLGQIAMFDWLQKKNKNSNTSSTQSLPGMTGGYGG